jgi:hypothetical protein
VQDELAGEARPGGHVGAGGAGSEGQRRAWQGPGYAGRHPYCVSRLTRTAGSPAKGNVAGELGPVPLGLSFSQSAGREKLEHWRILG